MEYNIGHSTPDCRLHVIRNKLFLVPGTHADKPSVQKSYLLQCAIYSVFWCICAVYSAVLFVIIVLISTLEPPYCVHIFSVTVFMQYVKPLFIPPAIQIYTMSISDLNCLLVGFLQVPNKLTSRFS